MVPGSAATTVSRALYDGPAMRMRDLGALHIEVNGVDTAVRWRKPAQILATLLVSANRRVSIDTLLDVVWGEKITAATPGTLESHVWRLRKLMEPDRARRSEPTYLVNEAGGYRLVVNPENADSLRFAELAGQGDQFLASGDAARALRRYELALTLWRGRPFEPIADEEWTAAGLARLEELYGQVNEQRVEALLRTGAAETAIGVVEELTARLPFRERLWSQLMLGLYQAGRIEEALAAYRRARENLVDNIGLDPGPELRELHKRILDQDPALLRPQVSPAVEVPPADLGGSAEPADPDGTGSDTDRSAAEPDVRDDISATPAAAQPAARRHPELHLPVLRSELVGRDMELARLTRLVGRSRLTTLVGAGGAGKTRLAVEVARAAAELAPDGVWLIDLAAVDDADSVPDAVLTTIGIAEPTVGSSLNALRSYVRDRQVLLLVDNCEHLLDAVRPLLDALLAEDSQARIIATSREPLGVDGEVLWTLAPLAVREDVGEVTDPGALSPAARLFVSKAENIDATFEPSATALTDVEAICSAVDGIPLAIELAAGRIRSASLAEVREQVTTALGELARVGYTRTEHHRTVELSIEWSTRLLTPAERAAHERLSVLPGAFTVETARAVLAAAPTQAHDTADLLSQLVHRSLLFVMPNPEPGQPTRFRQLATVRAHAATTLAAGGELDEVLERRREWADDLMAVRPRFDAADTDGWYARVAHNHDTLTAVLHHCLVEHPDPTGVSLVAQLADYWVYRRRMAEGERWSMAALRLSGAPEADVALVELALAGLHAYRDRSDRAEPLLHSAIAKRDALDQRVYAQYLTIAAWCAFIRGDSALDFVDGEVRHAARDDPASQLWVELLEARTALTADGPAAVSERAASLGERAVAGGNVCLAWLGSALALSCAFQNRDPISASVWLERALKFQHEVGNVADMGRIDSQANIAAMVGDDERAVQLFARSSTVAFRDGAPWPTQRWTEATVTRLRHALSADRFDAAWRAGAADADPGGVG